MLLGLVSLGVGMAVFTRVALRVWSLLLLFMFPGVVILSLYLMLNLSFMLIILSAVLHVRVLYLKSAGFTARYVRMFPLASVLLSTSRAVRRAKKLWNISRMVVFGKFSLMSEI